MKYEYCHKKCKLGGEKSKEFLDKNNSAYDAALDFMWFADECFKTCPFKDQHVKDTENRRENSSK